MMNQNQIKPQANDLTGWVDERLQTEEPSVKAFPCRHCEAAFDTKEQLRGHMGGKHPTNPRKRGKAKKKRDDSPFRTPAFRRKMRNLIKAHWANRKKKPRYLSETPEYKKRKYDEAKARNLANGLTVQGKVPKRIQNGRFEPETPRLDFHSAADQVVAAARVLMHVAMGNRLP